MVEIKKQKQTKPRVSGPMHGVYFGKVAPKGSSGSHLNPADWLKLSHCLRKCCVTGLFPLFL